MDNKKEIDILPIYSAQKKPKIKHKQAQRDYGPVLAGIIFGMLLQNLIILIFRIFNLLY